MKTLFLSTIATAILFSSGAVAEGDPDRGKKIFNKCKACHALADGKHKNGPSLNRVVGKKAGSSSGFKRYRGLKGAEWFWTDENLDQFLENPRKFVKNKSNKRSLMILRLKKKRDRDDIIAYLKSLP